MKASAIFMIVLVAVGICAAAQDHEHPHAHPHPHSHPHLIARTDDEKPSVNLENHGRDRRSPQGHAKVSVLEDSKKGPVAKVEGSGTVWESRDKNVNAKVGVDYTQPLGHGKGDGSAFFRVEGKF